MRQSILDTRWDGNNLLVLRDDQEVDRLPTHDIQRVILVCQGGDAPSDLQFAVIETGADHILLPATSGIAGRVHFEHQGFWTEHACVYWIDVAHAPLPRRLLPGVWLLRRQVPGFVRLPHAELASVIDTWPVEGPQSWEQRKWAHITSNRMLAPADGRRQPHR